ncbi:MAG: hypothetical protein HRU13_04675 [Phycisphaerales bacterium]|nr:hypothetical protein [Phycisphaerales bacterium]
MTDLPPVKPQAIDIERTDHQEIARDRADKMFRAAVLSVLIDIALVAAFFIAVSVQSIQLDTWVIVLMIASAPLLILLSGALWLSPYLQRKHYNSRSSSTWTLRCDDVRHEWRIEGIGPSSAWRDITIACKKLPRAKDKLIASPKLHVRLANDEGVIKSGHLEAAGEHTSMFVIDKVGLPIGITIGHIEPKHASLEEPWVVELTVFGDADTLETLLAWPVASHGGDPAADSPA